MEAPPRYTHLPIKTDIKYLVVCLYSASNDWFKLKEQTVFTDQD